MEKFFSSNMAIKIFISGISLIMLLIFFISTLNTRSYYIKSTDGAIEIWQGQFAPLGRERLITLPGAVLTEHIKDSYSKEEIFPIACNYYLDRSDAFLNVAGMPDLEIIKSDLNKARSYAVTKQLKDAVGSRLNAINFMVFLYNADVATSNATISGLKKAKDCLEQAKKLTTDKEKSEMVDKKIDKIQQMLELEKSGHVERPSPVNKEPENQLTN